MRRQRANCKLMATLSRSVRGLARPCTRSLILYNVPNAPLPVKFSMRLPEGDHRERLVCEQCGVINYTNPRIVSGVLATDDQGRILLGRRGIFPRRGFWGLPAGYLETSEVAAAGAQRELLEETGASCSYPTLIAMYEIPAASQMHVWHHAMLTKDTPIFTTPETTEVRLFRPDELPDDSEIAFPSVRYAIRHFLDGAKGIDHRVIKEPRGPKATLPS